MIRVPHEIDGRPTSLTYRVMRKSTMNDRKNKTPPTTLARIERRLLFFFHTHLYVYTYTYRIR